jgi:transposase
VTSLDGIINESQDAREVKRALSVKMGLNGMTAALISQLLNVSLHYVSQWKVIYEAEGAPGLGWGYQGSQGYLTDQEREAVITWINGHATLSVEVLRDHLEAT